MIAFVLLIITWAYALYAGAHDSLGMSWVIRLTVLGVVSIVITIVSLNRHSHLAERYEDRRLLEQAEQLEAREAELVAKDETSIGELWTLTNERLRGYHERASRQADQSFRNAQIAIFFGFLIVAATAGIAAWKTGLSTPSSIVVGVIGTVGAGLAAYIGRTFLRLQETTATHMRSYFDQPTETFRYLVAERLIDRLPEAERVTSVEYLVQAVMLSGLSVEQMGKRLAESKDNKKDKMGEEKKSEK